MIEGLDGAGTTTQTQRLVASLRGRGHRVIETCEPSDGPVGRLIRAALTRQPGAPDPATLPWMFAADRSDHLHRTILPALAGGAWVVSDRYVPSSLAYQSTTLPLDAVYALNARFRVPDLTIFLAVSPEVALARIAARGGPPELFEDATRLRHIAACYEAALALLETRGDPLVRIDGDAPPDEVAAAIRAALPP